MKTPRNQRSAADQPFAADGSINVIIETPKGSRNKFKYDEKLRRYRLCSVLPSGSVFPYDFGFVPGTKAQDGDPTDVLLLMDESVFPGCLVVARLIGVIEAEQKETSGKSERNDRLICVAQEARDYRDVRTLSDINKHLLDELIHFFISYNEMKGKEFTFLGAHGPKPALKLLKKTVLKSRK